MKKILLYLFICIFASQVNAAIITGEIEYNNKHNIYEHYIDSNNQENVTNILNGNVNLSDRKLVSFSDGSYGIQYYDDPNYSWYYSKNGRLISFTKNNSLKYPCNYIKYKPDGSIINKGYRVSENESFIYSSDGRLIAHWLNNKCMDEYGKVIMTREEN